MLLLNIRVAATITTLLLCIAQNVPAQSEAQNGPGKSASEIQLEQKEVRNYALTMTNLGRYEAASEAYQALMTKDPRLAARLDSEIAGSGTRTIAGAVKIMETHAPIVSALRNSGLSVHDYVVMTYTLKNASSAVAAKRKGSKADFSKEVLPSNLMFVERHYEKINELLAAISGSSNDKDDDDD